MPDPKMDDHYYLGIMAPARDAGYLCEMTNLATPETHDLKANELAAQKMEVEVHKLLVNHFDEDELRTLCFNLGVDYDSLPGDGKIGKARELVSHLSRRARLLELVETVRKQRPQAPWPDILQSTPPDQLLLERVKSRVDTACMLVADITTTNPNIFLLIGYAMGREIPIVIVTRDATNVPIDVRSQRCIVYVKIRELKEALTREFLGTTNG